MAFYRERSSLTLASINQDISYTEKISVRVVKRASGTEASIKLALADGSGWMRAKVTGEKTSRFQEGKSYTIKKFSARHGIILLNDSTEVFRTHPVRVEEVVIQEAQEKLEAPVHPFRPIEDVHKTCQQKKMVSVKGVIVTNKSATKTSTGITIKEIQIEDNSGKIFVGLWRETANTELSIGDSIILKDVVASFNTYHKQVTLSVNYPENLEITSSTDDTEIGLIGINTDEPQESVEVLIEINSLDRKALIKWETLLSILQLESGTMDDIVNLLPAMFQGSIDKFGFIKISEGNKST